jgi:NADPH-dependent 2,4-dienoyl-CoA reductase/sulfur reductase-like enzyme
MYAPSGSAYATANNDHGAKLMDKDYDYLVIGAGPAGMAAAIEASQVGLKVLVLDQAASAGGQIYRNLGHSLKQQVQVLGPDYVAGKPLLAKFMAANCDYIALAQVWHIEAHGQGYSVAAIVNGETKTFITSHLLLANGAMERPMAVAGWHKPGVMTAGAGQILLKSSGLLPKQVVLAGSGPLLLLLAQQYRTAGVTIIALLDTTPKINYWRALPWLLAGLSMPMQLLKGLWLTLAQRFTLPYMSGVSNIEIIGQEQVTGVRFKVANKEYELACNLVMLHQGIIAQTQVAQLLGCEQVWHEAKQCWLTKTKLDGQTSCPGVQVAGDAGTIGGAALAQLQGQLAGRTRALANSQHRPWRLSLVTFGIGLRIKQLLWARGLVDRLYQPASWLTKPAGNTIVCRCEQVSAEQITAVAAGVTGVNQLKAFTRAGMGPCQGRQCGLNLGYLVAHAQARPMAEVDPLTIRPPLSPVTLGQLERRK